MRRCLLPLLPSLLIAAALSGCAPEAARRGAPDPADLPAPELVPLRPILKEVAGLKTVEDPTAQELSRAEALRKRAEALRELDPDAGL